MKVLQFFVCCVLFAYVSAASGIFSKSLDAGGKLYPRKIISSSSNPEEFIIVGDRSVDTCFICKFNDREVVWAKEVSFDEEYYTGCDGLVEIANDEFLIAGEIDDETLDNHQVLLLKINGAVLVEKGDGNVLISYFCFLIRLDPTLSDLLMVKKYTLNTTDYPSVMDYISQDYHNVKTYWLSSLVETSSGDFVLAGNNRILKIDSEELEGDDAIIIGGETHRKEVFISKISASTGDVITSKKIVLTDNDEGHQASGDIKELFIEEEEESIVGIGHFDGEYTYYNYDEVAKRTMIFKVENDLETIVWASHIYHNDETYSYGESIAYIGDDEKYVYTEYRDTGDGGCMVYGTVDMNDGKVCDSYEGKKDFFTFQDFDLEFDDVSEHVIVEVLIGNTSIVELVSSPSEYFNDFEMDIEESCSSSEMLYLLFLLFLLVPCFCVVVPLFCLFPAALLILLLVVLASSIMVVKKRKGGGRIRLDEKNGEVEEENESASGSSSSSESSNSEIDDNVTKVEEEDDDVDSED